MTLSLSVVVPARNAARTLGATLVSLAYADQLREIIVVDDSSSDETVDVAREAGRSLKVPVRLVRQGAEGLPVCHGASAARNAGAATSTGDVLAFVDADDLWCAGEPDVRLAALEDGADIAVGRAQCIREVEGTTHTLGPPFRAFLNGTALIRREVFDAVGGFETDLDRGEELDWFLRARADGMRIEWVEDVVLKYRQHPGTASAAQADRHHGLMVALQRSISRDASKVSLPASPDEPSDGALSVSVILPVLNGARHLDEALNALGAQSRLPLEVLVVDGGSRDASREIALRHSFVQLLDRPGSGVADAHNAGLRVARGELIAFCAADDILNSHSLGEHVRTLAGCPTASMSLGLVEFFADADGASPRVRDGLAGSVHRSRILEALVVRRTVIDRYGAFRTDLGPSADVEWVERLASNGVEIVDIDAVVVRKRLHRANVTYSRDATGSELIRALRIGIDRKRSMP